MFKKFFIKTFLSKKLKTAGLSDAQIDALVAVIEKNPDFFKKLQAQIEAKKKQGVPETAAMMTVMRENQGELQKIMAGLGK